MRVKVIARPPEFDAIKYTGDNDTSVAAFVGFFFRPATSTEPAAIYNPIAQFFQPLEAGSWVVLIGATHTVLTATEFEASYRTVED